MIQLIQVATGSTSNQERLEAERKIIELRDVNPQQFFLQVVEVLGSAEAPSKVRETSGTLIAVSAIAKAQNGTYIWDTISGNMKNTVKASCLGALLDADRNIRRSAANAVSSICFVQLPRNQWDGIVDKICSNISHENEVVKESSVLTLGFICSRMKQIPSFEFKPEVQSSILSGIILCFQQPQPLLIKTALKALRDSIGSLSATLKNSQYRDFVLKQVVDIINNQTYTEDGLQILGEFVKTCYEFLGPYMDGLPDLLEPIISNHRNEDCCIAGMEIWENIAGEFKETELENPTNYITGVNGQKIVASLLKNLSVMEDQDQNDDNPISDSASKALESIFGNGSTQYQPLVLEFVKASIAQNDWKHRQASIKGFSLLLYGLSDTENQTLISGSINQLIGLLNDNSKQVQYATMQSLIIITEVCGKNILTSSYFVDYLKLILSKLSISQKFLKSGCRIVDNLCEAEKQYRLGKFSTISDDLIGLFLKYALSSDSTLAVVSWSTITIMNILEVTQSPAVILKYLTFVLQNFDNVGQIKESEKREMVTSAFFTFMQFCLHGLKKTTLEQTIIMSVYNKVTTYFKAISDVNADGFYAIEALVSFFNGEQALVDDFWPYIVHALQKLQDPVLFRATISCLASFVNCYGETLANRLKTFVPILLELVPNLNFGKQLKIDCLVLLGEVFLSCGKPAQAYLQQFLQVIMMCCTAALQMAESDFGYSQLLKDNIIQALMCIVHGLNFDKNINQQIPTFIPQIFNFVALSCNKKYKPTVTYVKKCLLLLADFAKFYPTVVKPLKQEQFIEETLGILKNFNKTNEYTQVIAYVKTQFK